MAGERQKIDAAINKGKGVLRLAPSWVPRSFCIPGKRLKLHPSDYYAFGAHRGGIDERWFSSTTKADNGPETLPDEGLSYICVEDGATSKVLLKDAIELAGNELLGPAVMKKHGGWVMYSKFFDNQEPLPFHVHQTDERAADVDSQFLAYVNQLRANDVDVAGDFIYTASLLIHIKSKMLLPHADTGPEQAAEDPRRELVERLLEHERFKNAAQMLQQKQMLEAATWSNPGAREFKDDVSAEPEIAADTVDLVRIFRDILERARNRPVIDVEEDSVTVSQMIQFLARRLTLEDKPVALRRLLSHTHSERALIAMFLALLEMVRLQAILLRQDRQFSEIFIKKHSNFETVMNEGLGAARDDWR